MSGSQVSKLRKQSFKYISEKYLPQLQKKFNDTGFTDVELKLSEVKSTDEDPVKIAVVYQSVTDKAAYLSPQVLIELGSRSLIEPFTKRQITSFVGEQFKDRNFADAAISIPTVNPERTFFEKVFLLHEEFQQSAEKIKINRITRHPYDLEKIMDTGFGKKAISDKDLYTHIVEHRKTITPLRGIDYANHVPEKINIIPPGEIVAEWKKDYELMQESMIYKESLSFDKLMERIKVLNERINKIKH